MNRMTYSSQESRKSSQEKRTMCEKARQWNRFATLEDQETEVECSGGRESL